MIKSRPVSLAAVESKDPRFLAINHSDVPCTVEQMRKNGKAIPIKFTLLKPLCAGFGAAPYSAANKKDPSARKYSQLVFQGTESLIRMFPYEKAEVVGDKGPLVESRPFDMRAGNTVTLFVDAKRIKEDVVRDKPCLPPNTTVVPRFSLCDITLAPKNAESADKGSCIKITMVRVVSYTLHSLWPVVTALPRSLQDARKQQLEHAEAFAVIQKDLETRDVPFVLRVSPHAQIDDLGVEARLVNWGGEEPIVIPADVLLRYTNSTRQDWAIALLNVAISCDAVHMLVFSSDFWTREGSIYKGLPLIDTEHLLQCVEPGESVDTRYSTAVDQQEFRVHLTVDRELTTVQSGPEPPAPDLVLACKETALAQAYPISFALVNDDTTVSNVWRGFVNAARGDGLKRKRFSSMAD